MGSWKNKYVFPEHRNHVLMTAACFYNNNNIERINNIIETDHYPQKYLLCLHYDSLCKKVFRYYRNIFYSSIIKFHSWLRIVSYIILAIKMWHNTMQPYQISHIASRVIARGVMGLPCRDVGVLSVLHSKKVYCKFKE